MFQMDTRAVFARPVLVSLDVIYAWAANARRKACTVHGARCGTSETKRFKGLSHETDNFRRKYSEMSEVITDQKIDSLFLQSLAAGESE